MRDIKTNKMKTNLKTNKMKKTILTLALAFVGTFAMAQEMTIAHTGITTVPTSTDMSLTVSVGEIITFIHGGGQAHPMTESHPNTGATSTPIPFVTQTVSSSIPSTTFQLNTAGVYKFHCGNNSGASDKYGTIYVTEGGSTPSWDCDLINGCIDPGTGNGVYTSLNSCQAACNATGVEENVFNINIYPNPANNTITIEGLNGLAQVFDVNGKIIMDITNGTFDVSELSKGTYVVKSEKYNTLFIKE